MNENTSKDLTVDDFNFICRVCLEIGEGMVDIFRSGLENQIMEVTNLRMELEDKLPKTLCQKCKHQVNQLFLFLQQAKSSDVYLRTLLSNSKRSCMDPKFKEIKGTSFNKKTSHEKRWQKKSKFIEKIKNDSENDKMYLIFVPEAAGSDSKVANEIVIKDLNSDSENVELKNYCRTLVKSYSSDHTYPIETKYSFDDQHEIENFKSSGLSELKFKDSKTHPVNLHIYECKECKSEFEEFDDLTAHFITHEVQTPILKSNFNCPVCDFSVGEKPIFMEHLKIHKKEGFLFVKVNGAGEILPVVKKENSLFLEPFLKDCKVFTVNLNSLNCTVCSENIESTDTVLSHLESCLLSEKSEIKFCINYLCPMCYKLFTDEEKKFIEHLSFHREENCFFIKVDSRGEPVQLGKNDELFISFEEAVKLFNKRSTVFQIIDMNSCDKCDFTSKSFKELQEHCNYIHFENITDKISLCCPVCAGDYQGENIDERQTKFYEHLNVHKNEGFSFILVKRNGTMAHCIEKYSDIFTQSLFLWSLTNSYPVMLQNISPELVILNEINSSADYICDLCKKQFKKKHKLIAHFKSHQTQKIVQARMNYICEKCGKKCLGKLNYKKHFLKHLKSLPSTGKRPVCTTCNKTFANKATLHRHMKHHVKEGIKNELFSSLFGIICEKCGKSFSNNASLAKHKKMHAKETENKVIKCEICDREFFRQSTFERHKSAHLNPKYSECGICKLPLPSLTSLQKHSEVHKNGSTTFDCRTCKLSFLTKDSLTAHQTHTGHYLDKKPLECNVCHEKFFIGRKFSEHIKTHPKYKMGECTLCGKRLSTIQSLMLHMGRHFESNSILCPHCGKQFFEERNYHRHLLTHEGIKPFPCDIEDCRKSFYTLFELNRHKKYHNNTRDFRCLYCSKSFHEANHLTVHVRTHTGERPYTCPHCNKGFVTRTHCKHHIKLVHQGIGYDLIKSSISKKVTVFETVEAIV